MNERYILDTQLPKWWELQDRECLWTLEMIFENPPLYPDEEYLTETNSN